MRDRGRRIEEGERRNPWWGDPGYRVIPRGTVGLVQREIEVAGIPTVSLSMIPEFTAAPSVPRVAGIAYSLSRPLGSPGDADGQRAVLRAALAALEEVDPAGAVTTLPFSWPEPAKTVRHEHLAEPPPIARLLRKKPWLYRKLVSGDIPSNATGAA